MNVYNSISKSASLVILIGWYMGLEATSFLLLYRQNNTKLTAENNTHLLLSQLFIGQKSVLSLTGFSALGLTKL